jgi:CheY-like chemotaxis protein
VFLAMLAHELRNPLAPLQTAQHLLDSRSDPDTISRLREIISRQTRQLTRLVDDLLDVSRITRGAIGLRKETVSAQRIVHSALEAMRTRIAERRHRIHVGLPEAPAWVDADPMRMIQVLSNLVDNSVKYTEPGGDIFVSVGVAGGEVLITVRDTGIGMQKDMLRSAFHLFTQADNSLARSQGGLGIGLTLVRSLVEMHGGHVSAASPGLGLGSELLVRLPQVRPVAAEAAEIGAHEDPPRVQRRAKRKRVLIVDDNCDSVETMEMVLARSGYDVRVAYDGAQALEAARSFVPDVGLIDIGLPGMDGYEVARRLRAKMPAEKLRLVAVTGYGQEADRQCAIQAGFDAHLVKPVVLDAILRELAVEQAG